jgi:hypothetical protein
MRLVRAMDERFYKDLVDELERGFQELARKFDHYSPGNYPLSVRVEEGDMKFPFPLAAEIYHIYRYLAGLADVPEHMYDTLQHICELVWRNPFTEGRLQIEWELWEKTKLGFFVRCSFIAIALDAGESINSKQLSLMAGITPTAVIKQIREGKLPAEKKEREWEIQAQDALEFLKLQFNEGTRDR